MPIVKRSFYQRDTKDVARELLGMVLYHRLDGVLRGGRIVEVEAYLGPEDRASHAKLRKVKGVQTPTERSALMFGEVGRAYVYLIYGMHHCVNAVAHEEGAVGAVLLRALEPLDPSGDADLRGPARLCAGLKIDRTHNGLDLCAEGSALWIEDRGDRLALEDMVATPRIGVDYAGDDALLPYRYCDRRSLHLSRKLK